MGMLCRLNESILANNIMKLAVPKLACGLDRLNCRVVRNMVEVLFTFTRVEILLNEEYSELVSQIDEKENSEFQKEITELKQELMNTRYLYNNEIKKNADMKVSKLKNLIQLLGNECENGTAENEQLLRQIDELNSKLNSILFYREKLEKECNEVAKNVELSKEIITLKEERKELRNKLKDISRENKELKTEYDKKLSENVELHAHVIQLKNEIDCCSNHEKILLKDYEQTVIKNLKLETQVTELKANHSKEVERNQELSIQIDELKTKIDIFKNDHQLVKESYEKETKKNIELKNEIESISKSKQFLQVLYDDEVSMREKENTKLLGQIQHLENQLSNMNELFKEASELKNHIKYMKDEQKRLEEDHKNKLASCTHNYQLLQEAYKKEIELQQLYDKEVSTEKLENSKLLAKNQDLENRLSKSQKQLNEISGLKNKVDYMTNEQKMLKEDYEKILKSKNLLQEKYENKTAKNVQVLKKMAELQIKVGEAEKRIKELEIEKVHLKLTCSLPKHKNILKKDISIDKLKEQVAILEDDISFEVNKSSALSSTLCLQQESEAELRKTLEEREMEIYSLRQKLREIVKDYPEIAQHVNSLLTGNVNINDLEELALLPELDDYKKNKLLYLNEMLSRNQTSSEQLQEKVKILKRDTDSSTKVLQNIKCLLTDHIQIVCDCNEELKRAYSYVRNIWNIILSDGDTSFPMPDILECHDSDVQKLLEILKQNIIIIALFLELLSKKSLFVMEDNTNQSVLRQFAPIADSLLLKRYVLRCVRPMTPDSSFNYCENIPSILEAFESDEMYEFPIVDFDQSTKDVFPHLSDDILLNLGLNEGSPKKKLSRDETEEVFTSFAIHFGINSKDIKEKLDQQLALCREQHDQCFRFINDISKYLQNHIGQEDTPNVLFTVNDLKSLIPVIVHSSFLLGMLRCENRMVKCWNMVINYVAMLKQCSEESDEVNVEMEGDITKLESETETESLEEESQQNIHRHRLFDTLTSTMKWCLLILLLIFAAILSLHLHCRARSHHFTCPLDGFIEKIQLGEPPY